jgi:hypothetical protein
MNEWMQGESDWEDCRSARHGPHVVDWSDSEVDPEPVEELEGGEDE